MKKIKYIKRQDSGWKQAESCERVHSVSMWHRHGTRSWDFLQKHYPNIRKADGYQLRFVYEL